MLLVRRADDTLFSRVASGAYIAMLFVQCDDESLFTRVTVDEHVPSLSCRQIWSTA